MYWVASVGDKPFLKPSGKWMIPGAIILALGVGGIGVFQAFQQQPNEAKSASKSTDKKSRAISALGRLEPAGRVIQVGGPSGERILRLVVKEGQQLDKGETIAFLESYPERQVEVKLAASRLLEVQNQFVAEQELGKAQLQEAKTRQSQAENPKMRAIVAQDALVRRSKVEFDKAQIDLSRYQFLLKAGAVSQQDLESKILEFQSKRQQFNNAIATRAMLEEELQTDSTNAQAQMISTKAGSLRSQAQLDLASAQSNLELAKARMTQSIIRAPRAGQILEVHVREGESIPAVSGTDSEVQKGIVEMGNTRQMYAVAEVYETDINNIKKGQIAKISSPVIKGDIEGTVDEIGLKIGKNDVVGTDPAANTDTRVVEVKIRLNNSIAVAGLTNLQVNVAIHPEEEG